MLLGLEIRDIFSSLDNDLIRLSSRNVCDNVPSTRQQTAMLLGGKLRVYLHLYEPLRCSL